MPFPDSVKNDAFRRSGGRCENCNGQLTMSTAEFHHIKSVKSGGSDLLSNCKVLCHGCHVRTHSYGTG
jgi:5-methylcytosine-specific restriction endonuclease McrA